jgi:hypothetical protein
MNIMIVFWVAAPYTLIDFEVYFKGIYCLHQQENEKPVRKKQVKI